MALPPDPNPLGDAWGFGKGLVSGVGDGIKSAADGVVDLAKGGYALATDEAAREQAWQTAKQLARAGKDYAGRAYDDPAQAFTDAKDGANRVLSAFEKARDAAAARGESGEFWGQAAGRAAFEVGAMLVPVGAATKFGKLAEGAKTAEQMVDGIRAADKLAEGGTALAKAEAAVAKAATASDAGHEVLPCGKAVAKELGTLVSKTPVPARILEKLTDAERAVFEKAVREVEETAIVARPDKAVFYSGMVGDQPAWKIAEQAAARGEVDSVNTLTGNLLNRPEIRDVLPDDAMGFIDDLASAKLAAGASGDLNLIGDVNTIREASVFRRIELPALLNNDAISPASRQKLLEMKAILDGKYGG